MLMSDASSAVRPSELAAVQPLPPISSPPDPSSGTGFGAPASDDRIERTATALRAHGIDVVVVPDREAAKQAVLSRIPAGAEVLAATSQTLAAIGLADVLSDPAKYAAVRPRLLALSTPDKSVERRKLGAAPEYVVGSVHAVTEKGQVVVASATGSQLAAYAFGAEHVVWVVGAQKLVPDLETAIRRINEHSFPLENARAQKAYGRGTAVAKLLIFNQEIPGRISMVLVKEALGF
jgi:LUD domain